MLAIDTSTRTASVALASPDATLAEYTWHAGMNHSRQLLPAIRALLHENQAEIAEVTALAVAMGPGSFNGLRVGMATAKGFASSLGIPLVALGTLEVEAFQHAAVPWPICALQDAGRGELASSTYFQEPQAGWGQLLPERISTPEELIKTIRRRTLLCGEVPAWCLPPAPRRARLQNGPGGHRGLHAAGGQPGGAGLAPPGARPDRGPEHPPTALPAAAVHHATT